MKPNILQLFWASEKPIAPYPCTFLTFGNLAFFNQLFNSIHLALSKGSGDAMTDLSKVKQANLVNKSNKQLSRITQFMDEDEKNFTRLQTDVQNWLALSLALLASMIAALIGEWQSYFVKNQLNGETIFLLLLTILFGVLAAISIYKFSDYRKQMGKTTKAYD